VLDDRCRRRSEKNSLKIPVRQWDVNWDWGRFTVTAMNKTSLLVLQLARGNQRDDGQTELTYEFHKRGDGVFGEEKAALGRFKAAKKANLR